MIATTIIVQSIPCSSAAPHSNLASRARRSASVFRIPSDIRTQVSASSGIVEQGAYLFKVCAGQRVLSKT
jgi:hypothetical protein